MGLVTVTATEVATHSSILAWEIPGTEEPGRLQSWDCKSRHNLATRPKSDQAFRCHFHLRPASH